MPLDIVPTRALRLAAEPDEVEQPRALAGAAGGSASC